MRLRSLTAILLVGSVLSTCPPGTAYDPSLNKCFQYVNVSSGYLAAESHCITLGGHLQDIQNAFENSNYNGQMQGGQSNWWIGLNFLTNPAWAWSTGSAATYTNWAPNQPSNSMGYLCASMRPSDGKWITEPCYSHRPYVCKIEPDQAPPAICTTSSSSTLNAAGNNKMTSSTNRDSNVPLADLYRRQGGNVLNV